MIEHKLIYDAEVVKGRLVINFKNGRKQTFNLNDIESVATEKIL